MPSERLWCLAMAKNDDFATSVSIEPMLAGRFGAIEVFDVVRPYVSETVWIGKMNKALLRVDKVHEEAVRNIIEMQSDDEIIRLVESLKRYPQIRWKDSIKTVIAEGRMMKKEKAWQLY